MLSEHKLPTDEGTYCFPLCRVLCNAFSLIDGLIAAADVNVAVVVRVILDQELIILELELFQGRSVLHIGRVSSYMKLTHHLRSR